MCVSESADPKFSGCGVWKTDKASYQSWGSKASCMQKDPTTKKIRKFNKLAPQHLSAHVLPNAETKFSNILWRIEVTCYQFARRSF
jgi:hypothetical protein